MSAPREALGLALLAFAGLCLAMTGALGPVDAADSADDSEKPLAQVGERRLTAEDMHRVLAAQAGARRGRADAAELEQLLALLVDEELLIQRAETLGLIDTDPALRRALQTAMKQEILSHGTLPSEKELRELWESKREHYGELPFDRVRARVLRDHQRAARQRMLESTLVELRNQIGVTYIQAPEVASP